MDKESFSKNTMIVPVTQNGRSSLLLYQNVTRAGVLVSHKTLSLLNAMFAGDEVANETQVESLDVTGFSLSDYLHDNPLGVVVPEGFKFDSISFSTFLNVLRKRAIIGTDDSYLAVRGKKTSILDKKHIGNFHQHFGNFLFIEKKGDPEDWWVYQKFEKDLSGARDNLYGWAHDKFIRDYFDHDLSGQKWLDFGCGAGVYTRYFAEKGADVVGVDPSQKYIDLARNQRGKTSKNPEFITQEFNCREDFKSLEGRKFDRIFLGDVLLFFFEPYKPIGLSPAALLSELTNLLNPNGRIYIIDPHGFTFLQSRFGEQAPYLVCTEYKNRKFRVCPTLEEMSAAIESAGLVIRKIREPMGKLKSEPQTQAQWYSQEFPAWWFFELSR
jgi:SAM-dependent methyltransferase